MSLQTSCRSFLDYYRCPESLAQFEIAPLLSEDTGYFRFGSDLVCYGRTSAGFRLPHAKGDLYDVSLAAHSDGAIVLPCDPDEIVDNLRLERYAANCRSDRSWKGLNGLVTSIYYTVRPWLNVSVRKYLQRVRLAGWQRRVFPRWPLDTTVDDLLRRLMTLAIQKFAGPVPFIWFWPDGASSCALLTHDVESLSGYQFCSRLMDIDEEFGFRSSFQFVPKERYRVSAAFIDEVKKRGFEVNVHDFNHDGYLFRDRETFLARSSEIKRYATQFGARGFRSGAMYRHQTWLTTLGFEYDMSVPNTAHLDPQKGGCCTVMPYFIEDMLELPTTALQDYALLHMLNQGSIELWRRQIGEISQKYGLANFIIHPDYIREQKATHLYVTLLGHLKQLQNQSGLWVPRPDELNDWWRARRLMQLVEKDGKWQVKGPQSEHARVAYATVEAGQLTYQIEHPVHA